MGLLSSVYLVRKLFLAQTNQMMTLAFERNVRDIPVCVCFFLAEDKSRPDSGRHCLEICCVPIVNDHCHGGELCFWCLVYAL